MVDIALNAATHDIIINEDDIMFIDDAERVAQQIKIQLMTFLGEWFLDTTHGVPYLEQILVKNPDGNIIEAILRSQILKVPDVVSVDDMILTYDPKKRTLEVEFWANTNYGMVTRREVLGYGITR